MSAFRGDAQSPSRGTGEAERRPSPARGRRRAERHPSWGPKKLRKKLGERLPDIAPPARSTIGDWLRKEGLTERRRPRRRCPPSAWPLAAADVPNAVWCGDFKGWFTAGDRKRCDLLTISDAMSRYLLRLRGGRANGRNPCPPGVRSGVRSDNGPPFASTGAGLRMLPNDLGRSRLFGGTSRRRADLVLMPFSVVLRPTARRGRRADGSLGR